MANVLIVDDSDVIRELMKEWLEEEGHTVAGVAETGIEAVEMFKEHRPDITTLDIEMPAMNGMHALKEIKEIDPDANVLMVSSHSKNGNLPNTLLLGACEFIEKPLSKDEFIKMINKLETYISKRKED